MHHQLFQTVLARVNPDQPATVRAAVTAIQHLVGLWLERRQPHLLDEAAALIQRLQSCGVSISQPLGVPAELRRGSGRD